jgi:hypothetical protein
VDAIVRRTPLFSFIAALVFALAALNEGNLNHWGTTIVLVVIAIAAVGVGILSLRA